ncbi:retinol dehydrogenase 13-like [Asterias rubens]|uniref:retinol dehydrogenase 13-like n=1 Tax=Asterias rubens TaxID=7604 RepID=UPI0014553FB0|nr:retinol dehydrogenase 13-like [Asterias rubens]
MACLSAIIKWVLPILVALYGVYYWQFIASRRYFVSDVVLNGKTVIVTGANSGIGRVTALDLAQRGARVILACRNLQKAEDVAKDIKSSTGNSEVVVRHLDLSSLQSVREFAQQIIETEDRLDILINNAGVAAMKAGAVTKDNFDFVFGTNHFGHFLLTNLLLDLLKKSALKRVVTVSSLAHAYAPEPNMTREDPNVANFLYPHLEKYPSSKLANVLFARELAKREKASGLISTSNHPGAIYTPIWKTNMSNVSSLRGALYYVFSPLMWMVFIDETAGAQTTLHCALDESVAELSGKYFDNSAEYEPSPFAQDDELAKELWTVSCEATGLNC